MKLAVCVRALQRMNPSDLQDFSLQRENQKPHVVLKTVFWDVTDLKPAVDLKTDVLQVSLTCVLSVLSEASSLRLLCFTCMLFSFSEQTRRVTRRCSLFVLVTGQIKAGFHL